MGDLAMAQPAGPIQPGAELKVTVPLPSNTFRIVEGTWPNELKPKNSLTHLPAGKYRVKINIAFTQPAPEKAPANPVWPGREITTQPVEIEIAAESSDKK